MNTKLLGNKITLFRLIFLGMVLAGGAVWQFGGFDRTEQEVPASIEAPTGELESSPRTLEEIPTMEGEGVVATNITIEGDEFSFSPESITVAPGATVELTFKNIGKAPHNYVVTELGLKTKTIGGGKTDVVTFRAPDSAGTISYTSFCSIPGHLEAGMVGTIEIK
jgi:plastocyanin